MLSVLNTDIATIYGENIDHLYASTNIVSEKHSTLKNVFSPCFLLISSLRIHPKSHKYELSKTLKIVSII